jgi:hypothetical protein
MSVKNETITLCGVCSKEVYSKASVPRSFCSPECFHVSRRGVPAWNAGKQIGDRIRKKTLYMQYPCANGCGKDVAGYPSEQRKYCSLECRSQHNAFHFWTGTKTEYKAIHHRVGRLFGKPTTCESCGTTGLTRHAIHWANRTGEYLLEREDWLRLCAKCHREYDMRLARG